VGDHIVDQRRFRGRSTGGAIEDYENPVFHCPLRVGILVCEGSA
jgi:hypothetical protein